MDNHQKQSSWEGVNLKRNFLSFNWCAIVILGLAIKSPMTAYGDDGVMRMDGFRRPAVRKDLHVPNLKGYVTLKCDFHMHTVFSDGLVWPTIRVQEAWEEGLDAICITDHIEYQPHQEDIPTKHDRPYEVAEESAHRANVLIIKGSEITRDTPPGHFNAIFVHQASGFIAKQGSLELDRAAINQASAQNAFIFWNHPGWKANQIEGSYAWIPFVEEIYKEGKLHGIEVFNGFGFHKIALDWCVDKGLAVMGNSDIHNLTAHDYDFTNGRTRTMTLVFAKERTKEGIREALETARTVAWSSEYLAGPESLVRQLFEACITVGPVYYTDRQGRSYAEIANHSDIGYQLNRTGDNKALPATLHLRPQTTQTVSAKDLESSLASIPFEVANVFIRSDQNLKVHLKSK